MTLLKKLTGKYKILLGLFLFSISFAQASQSSRIIETEIEISEAITIRTNGPDIPSMELTGTMSSNTEKGFYSLRGRGEEFLRLNRGYNIMTWDQNKVKQTLSVTVRAASPEIEQKILNALESDLKINPDNTLDISGLMELRRITMKNSWLKKDNDNTITLNNGEQYKFEYLELSASLHVPKNASLEIDAEFTDLRLGELNGSLDLKLKSGVLSALYINNLVAQLSSSKLKVDEVKTATISAQRSTIEIKKAADLNIGEIEQTIGCMNNITIQSQGTFYSNHNTTRAKIRNSSLNKYYLKDINELEVFSSLNDKFNIDLINVLKLRDASFSDFEISTLTKSLSGKMEFGELNIYQLDNANFKGIELESSLSSLRIVGNNTDNIEVQIKQTQKKEEPHLMGLADNELNMDISAEYNLVSNVDKEFKYSKGDGEKKIYLSCNRCDLVLK